MGATDRERTAPSGKPAQGELGAYAAVTGALAGAASLDDASAAILHGIGAAMGWELGAVWAAKGDALRIVRIQAPPGSSRLKQKLQALSLGRGEGLAGRAWERGAPVWIDCGGKEAALPDVAPAAKAGMRRAIAIPLVGASEVAGVLVFWTSKATSLEKIVPFAATLGAQIGQSCDAARVTQVSREREAMHVAVLQAIPDVVFRVHRDGTIAEASGAVRKAPPNVAATIARESSMYVERALATRTRKSGMCRIAVNGHVRDYETRLIPCAPDEVLVLARDISDQTRTEEELQLFLGITLTTGDVANLRAALQVVLRLVCESTGWVVGQAWLPDGDERLHCSAAWSTSAAAPELRIFREASDARAFAKGEGLPGSVFTEIRPAWIRDVTAHPGYLRIDAARCAGLKTGFAVPVLADTEVVAVLEFYAFEPRDEDERMLTMVSAVAEQLGSLMKRKRAEEEFRLLETALQQITESIVITSAASPDDGPPRIVYVSPAFSRMTHYGPEEVIGRDLDVLSGPGTDRATMAKMRSLLAEGKVAELETINYRKDGTEVPLEWRVAPVRDAGGTVTHHIAIQRDISQRKQSEEAREQLQRALETAARQWRLTFDAIESPIMLLDREGRILRMNRAAKQLSGNEYKEQLGRGLDALGDDEPWRQGAAVVASTLSSRAAVSSQVRDEGRGKTWDFSATLLDETDDEKVILVVRDITRLVELQESLRRSETMSVMGSLVAGVAHEVRNPLHAITVTLDAFEARFRIGAEHQPHIGVLRGEVARLSALMRDLLEYGKPATIKMFDGTLRDVVEQAIAECASQATAALVTIGCDVPTGLAPVKMDRSRMGQVFQNILENAIQHCKKGGHVSVTASELTIGGAPWLECAIRDDGAGFREADLHRVFEPFFTRRRGGTGLGLSIVYRIVDEHGGTTTASNHPDGGGLVTVRLPVR